MMPPRGRQEELEWVGELVGVARGILRALQELMEVGKGMEEVQEWLKEDIKYSGGWLEPNVVKEKEEEKEGEEEEDGEGEVEEV